MGLAPRFALRAALIAGCVAPAVRGGQPAPASVNASADTATLSPADVFVDLSRGYRQGVIVERVDIRWRSPGGSTATDAIWVGVDATDGQAALALGPLRLWAHAEGKAVIIRAVHLHDPLHIVALEERGAGLDEALWRVVPASPAPQAALAFAQDAASTDLWPGLRGVRWRLAPQPPDAAETAAPELVGEAEGRRVALRTAWAEDGALRLDSIVVTERDGAKLDLRFTRVDPSTTGAGAPISGDASRWRLDIGARRLTTSLSALTPLPPMQPPVLFASDGRPARPAPGVEAIVLLDGDDEQTERLAQLGQRIAQALQSAAPDGGVNARLAIATRAHAEELLQRLSQWRAWLGEEPLWTPGGASRLSQYAGGADVDALLLIVRDNRAAAALALRADDRLAAPAEAEALRSVIQRVAREALAPEPADEAGHGG